MKYTEEELEGLVDRGDLTEMQALQLLERHQPRTSVAYIRNLNEAYHRYKASDISEDLFYKSLLKFIEKTVKRHSFDRSTFSNLEDAISDSVLYVWQRMPDYDPARSSFSTFVTMIVLSKIRNILEKYKTDRGRMPHVQLDEQQALPSKSLSAEKRLLFEEWLKALSPTDRSILRMLKDGLTQSEIGEALGISQSAVAQRLMKLRYKEKGPWAL